MKDKCTCEFYTLKLRETDDGVVFQMKRYVKAAVPVPRSVPLI